MQIRRATSADLDRLVELRAEFLAEVRGVGAGAFDATFRAATRAFFEAGSADETVHTWLAEDGTVCLGLVSVVVYSAPPRPEDVRTREGYVINLYVEPDHRRRGIARALMNECFAAAPSLGIRRFVLHATPDGRHLYESQGFAANPDWLELRLPSESVA